SRARSATPTGIDRVEMGYARRLLSGSAPHCFAVRNAIGSIGLLPAAEAAKFIESLCTSWRDGALPNERQNLISLARQLRWAALFGTSALHAALRKSDAAVYLSVSQQQLHRAGPVARLKRVTGAVFVCFVHDLIPIERPDLTRPGQTRRHHRRIATIAAHADAVIVNSAATREALVRRLGLRPPIRVAPLGIDLPRLPFVQPIERPYFICISTIEARKNHRLLFELWRRLIADFGERAPRLLLIGRRGFGSDRIMSWLGELRDLIVELNDLPDMQMARLLRGARALLLPSFAEGFGLPVAEALSQGVPVLCSDLPALRESGYEVPEYLDPHDSCAWHRAIMAYLNDSSRRQAQLARLAGARLPTWAEHFAIAEPFIADVVRSCRDVALGGQDRPAPRRLFGSLR
ncbi:MAG TPA: glycosyltransferase family 1 protein, partial [Stellaceae bacterium]|nr:glycosyltransferase family 1 protein [Stellaceae bacterium]